MDNMFRDISPVSMYVPQTASGTDTTITSDACDVGGFNGALFKIYYGASGDTLSDTVKLEAALWECATEGGTYTLVADADVASDQDDQDNAFGAIDASGEDSNLYGLSYIGALDFVKVVITLTGAHTTGTTLCVMADRKLPLLKTSELAVDP